MGRYQNWGLLLETKAKGKRLDQFLSPLNKNSLEKSLTRLAESLAELHQKKSEVFGTLPIDKFEEKITKILNNNSLKKELSLHLNFDLFIEYIQNIKKQASSLCIPLSYWHGDAHLGNMFYDEEKDQFYFIDVAKMHQSIDFHKEPLQDGAYDYFRALENFRRISLGTLEEEDYQYLSKIFEQTYLAKHPLDPTHITFYKTYTKMGRLIEYFNKDDNVFEESVNYFKNVLPFPPF